MPDSILGRKDLPCYSYDATGWPQALEPTTPVLNHDLDPEFTWASSANADSEFTPRSYNLIGLGVSQALELQSLCFRNSTWKIIQRMKYPLTFMQNHFLLYLHVLCLKKKDRCHARIGSAFSDSWKQAFADEGRVPSQPLCTQPCPSYLTGDTAPLSWRGGVCSSEALYTTQLRRKKQVCLMAHLGSSRTGQKFDFQGKLVKACDLLDPALLLQRPQGRRPPARPAFLALSQAPWALGRKEVENYWGVCGECPAQWQHLLNHSSLVPNLTFKRSDVNSWGNPVPWN